MRPHGKVFPFEYTARQRPLRVNQRDAFRERERSRKQVEMFTSEIDVCRVESNNIARMNIRDCNQLRETRPKPVFTRRNCAMQRETDNLCASNRARPRRSLFLRKSYNATFAQFSAAARNVIILHHEVCAPRARSISCRNSKLAEKRENGFCKIFISC